LFETEEMKEDFVDGERDLDDATLEEKQERTSLRASNAAEHVELDDEERSGPDSEIVSLVRATSGGGGDYDDTTQVPCEEYGNSSHSLLQRANGYRDHGIDWRATGLAFVFPATGGLLFGWDIGATSGALASIMDPATSGTDWYALTPFQQGLVVSISLAGALVASAVAAIKLGATLGGKWELQLAACFYALGALCMGAAPTLIFLLLGRFTYGLGIGFAMHAAPMYIAETSPPSVRGLLISLKECFIVSGILLGYLGSYVINGDEGGWRTLLYSSLVFSAILAAGMLTLPNSPRWLLQRGRPTTEARTALIRLRGQKVALEVIEAELTTMIIASEKAGVGGVGELLRRENLRPLYIGISLVLFQQITGQPSVLYYTQQVFTAAGYNSTYSAGISAILGGFKLVMTGFAVKYVDTVGRRPLLLGGLFVMVVSTIALGTCSGTLSGGNTEKVSLSARVSVAAIFTYVGAYQVSFGPIAWLLVGEIFPQRVRSAAIGTATLTNFLSNFLVSLSLPMLLDNLGAAGTYYLFSTLGVVAAASIYLTVVETKGRSLEEIEDIMTR
jgi:sugar porter (SP) family MFS transporter